MAKAKKKAGKAAKKPAVKAAVKSKTAPSKGKAPKERPATLTLAVILFFLSAVINLFAFIYILFLSPDKQQYLGEGAKLIVIIPGILGLLDLFSAYGLWNMRLYGGVVGVIDIVASVLVGYYQEPSYNAISLAVLAVNIFLLVLVITNWKKLE